MWRPSLILLFLGIYSAVSYARPTELQDIFNGFVKNVNLYNPEKQSQIVKRRIYEENPDSGLKQVSLQSLIGDLEQNFYQSASSASSLVQNQASSSTGDHLIKKRKTTDANENSNTEKKQNDNASTTSKDIVVETTEKIPAKDGAPAHLLVDHIAVQPHYGDLPIVPAFTLQHTKLISATIKDANTNNPQITITKANVQTVPLQVASNGAKKDNSEKKPEDDNAAKDVTSTTQKSAAELKEAEAELKEKVAEIEAAPVILSARV